MSHPPLSVAVLISGEGTNLQALIDAARIDAANFEIVAVFSDRRNARGLERARAAGIDGHYLSPAAYADRAQYDLALAEAIAGFDPGLLVLAGFMRILSESFVRRFEGRILNIHPSLLPRFKGLDTHRRVLEAGATEHGATVHFVTAALDEGPAALQYRIDVGRSDTKASLEARVHAGEHVILPQAVAWIAAGRLRMHADRAYLDDEPLSAPVLIEGK